MKNVVRTQAFLRKRKMMLVIPFLALPFVTLAFWSLGGGKGNASSDLPLSKTDGLNFQLPGAKLKDDGPQDKLSFYEKAAKDSMKLEELMRNDPYFQRKDSLSFNSRDNANELQQMTEHAAKQFHQPALTENRLNPSPYNSKTHTQKAEEQVMTKLAQLKEAINQPTQNFHSKESFTKNNNDNGQDDEQLQRLNKMMGSMKGTGEGDSEIQQLSSMMDKIMDIQHPERVKERIKEVFEKSNKPGLQVSASKEEDNISLLDTTLQQTPSASDDFFGTEEQKANVRENAIAAVIHEDQTLVTGAVVKFRLTQDMYIKGERIPQGEFVYGIAELSNERLNIQVHSVKHGSSIYPVNLDVYDMDGLLGIYIPGAITRDVAKQSSDDLLQSMQMASLDPSLKMQLTSAGIGVAKNLLTKKVKQVRVMLKAGYKVVLKDKDLHQ